MKQKFKVISCNANKSGGFVWKLQTTAMVTVFGINKTVKRTYYLGGMPQAINVGVELEEDINKFEIKEYPTAMIKNADGTATFMKPEDAAKAGVAHEILSLKWLHAKAA